MKFNNASSPNQRLPAGRSDQVFLAVENVTKNFGGLKAVDDACLEVRKGEILGLIGPNGAGKTTLFNIIAGVFPPSSGKVRFKDQDITGIKPHKICRMGICRTHQIVKPFRNMTALENVLVGVYFGHHKGAFNPTKARGEAKKWLAFTGLEKRMDEKVRNLTMVELKRLEIARALATEPELLLLDECMSGLNTAETSQTMKFIGNLRETGITIFLIEHVMRAVMGISNRIAVLHYGKKIAEGSPTQVAENDLVIEAYLGSQRV